MTRIAAWFAIFQIAVLAGLAAPAFAQDYSSYASVRTVTTESWVEEWDAEAGRWVRIAAQSETEELQALPTVHTTRFKGDVVIETREAARFARPVAARPAPALLAQYGPFVVTSDQSASLIGATDASSPRHFDAMLRDFPELTVLNLVEAPGTNHDIANLAVGRRIRAAGIATHVPNGGSVRSGAVELFLAGATRTLEDGAEFAVHSWLDNYGREADDFAATDPAHRIYLDYYVEMGMSEARAREFYAMTNSVPHASALWLRADDMRFWLRPDQRAKSNLFAQFALAADELAIAPLAQPAPPAIAYGNLDRITLAQIDLASLDSALAFP